MVEVIAERYVLLGDAARIGGQSTIRKASRIEDGSLVAIKMLTMGRDEILQKVFERETRTLASLHHSNIIRLLDYGVDDDLPFLVLEWVDSSLAEQLTGGDPYKWSDLVDVIAQPLLSAISYAHLKEIEHRDIKPGNILLRDSGEPVLADFGIAKLRADLGQSELTVASFRSRPYAPPEESSTVPYVRDVYSLGVVFLQALSTARIRDFPDIAPALEAVTVPPQLRDLLRRCVSTDINDRPLNGAVLLDEFNKAVSSSRSAHSIKASIHLYLTQRARTEIAKEFDIEPENAEGALLRDLAAETFAEFRLDRESGKSDHTSIFVVGDRCRYSIKVDSGAAYLPVVGARGFEYDVLEAMRRRSMPTRNLITWAGSQPRNRSAALESINLLSRAIADHEEARAAHRQPSTADSAVDTWFDRWSRLLNAREEIARGDLPILRYTAYDRRGREADFQLATPVETDLFGTEMQVVIEESGRRLTRGEVIDQDEHQITVRAASPFPNLPRQGSLVPFLGPTQAAVQRQLDAVAAVKDGRSARPDLRAIILDPSRVQSSPVATIDSWKVPGLDPSKKAAVAATLTAPDVTIVQGPPGTGKTTFIAELVGQTLARNPEARILIVSQTHVAVDNAIERLDVAGIRRVVRLGAVDNSRVDIRVRHLLLDQQMPKWAESLRRKAESYFKSRVNSLGLSEDHLRASLALRELAGVIGEIDSLAQRIEHATEINKSDPTSNRSEIITLQAQMERLEVHRTNLVAQADQHLGGDLTLSASLNQADARAAIIALVGETGAGPELLKILDLQAQWLQRVSSDENLAQSFLQTSSVIAGTCIGFLRHSAVRDLEIDLCILDEASKATATEALVPMARAKKWVLIGDSKQLPPMDEEILRRPELMEENDLDPDFVSRTLFQHFAEELPSGARFVLTEQYRMVRPIGDLISHCFYRGELHSPRTTGLPGFEILGKPVLWIDTKDTGPDRRETAQAGGTSYANRAEARLIIRRLKIIDSALDRGVIKTLTSESLEILLIAPYRSQVAEIRRRLASHKFKRLTLEVQTVDAVQGREADLAIFSVTRSNPTGRLGFLGPDYWRRINVALSRARFGLTIVGDAEFCSTTPGALQNVHRYIKQNPDTCEIRSATNA